MAITARVSGLTLLFLVLTVLSSTPAGAQPAVPLQCPALKAYVARFGQVVPDLGGGALIDEKEARVEPLGSSDCPVPSSTACEKLAYFSFMLALVDMSPTTYRRPGIAALLANLQAEDTSLGDKCSAESLSYSARAITANFATSLTQFFCGPNSAGAATASRAGITSPGGGCDTSDAGLQKLRDAIVSEVPPALALNPAYANQLGPIVARIYRYKNNATSDEEAFKFRGRGFIQITGRTNYQNCQTDIKSAKRYLSEHKDTAASVRTVSGIDWTGIDVTKAPEVVSQNRFVAAFCAASFWNRSVSPTELVWATDQARTTFGRIVQRVNGSALKVSERLSMFSQWCDVARCQSNFPTSLNVEAGFLTLAGLRRGSRAR